MNDFAIIIALVGVLACVVWIIVNSWPQLRPKSEVMSTDPRQKASGSEVRYRTLFEKSSDALLILDEGRFIDCNQATVNMLGYNSRKQVLQAHPSELSPKYQPDGQLSFTKANEMIATAFVRGSHRFEWIHKRANGESFPVEVLLTAIPKEDGQMLHVVWRDITERKLADEALQLSEARFRGFADAAADWFWEMGPDLRFTHVSGRVERALGLPPEKIVGKSRNDLYQGKADFQTSAWQQHFQLIEEHKPFSEFIVQWERPDGELRTISLSGNPLFSDDGVFLGYRGVGSNITERKMAEEEVRRLRNYLSNIIDSMPSMLIGVDGEGVVTQWNSEAAEVTRIPAGEAIGQALERVLPRLSQEMPRIRQSIDTKEELVDSKRAYRREGETRYEDITIYPLIADGVEGAVIRVDDVTEEVRIEEMMIQSEKMLSVGGLAAGMAHEINNPLAGMMQTANVLTNRLTKLDLPANQKVASELGLSMDDVRAFMEKRGILDLIGNISESGKRVATIVANMLSFARKADAIREPYNVSDLLDKTVELAATDYNLKQQYDFKSIGIVREYAEQLPLVVCEGAKIQQVLLNLLRNGAQAMQGNGTERPKFIFRTYREPERDMVCMEVEDNGPGIDEKTRKRIFEPFFTTKSVNEGTGLGLSVSYFIVTENHGGEMGVESELGKGAKFIIRLPIQKS